jgi:hypothetical protein
MAEGSSVLFEPGKEILVAEPVLRRVSQLSLI